MPNPFASQAPLSPAVGGNAQTHRRNPFASSAPLAGTGASAGSDGALRPAAAPPPAGPPPTSFAGGAAYPAHVTPSYGGGMYPTPPEMTPPGHQSGSHVAHASGPQQSGYQTQPQTGAPGGTQFSHGGAVPGQLGSPFGQPAIGAIPNNTSSGSLNKWDTGGSNSGPAVAGVGAVPPGPTGFVTPAHAVGGAAPTLFVPANMSPSAPTPGLNDAGQLAPPSLNAARTAPPSVLGVAGSVPGGGGGSLGGPPPAAPISLRGRERYCSGGAWVGPAPEWPRPPADATVANAAVSGVLPKYVPIVNHVRSKFNSLLAASTGSKRREIESLDQKLGGMLVFLNAGEGETHISAPVADALLGLCLAAEQNDTQNVNAYLLHISTHYWEEVAYWFPALKRLMRL